MLHSFLTVRWAALFGTRVLMNAWGALHDLNKMQGRGSVNELKSAVEPTEVLQWEGDGNDHGSDTIMLAAGRDAVAITIGLVRMIV